MGGVGTSYISCKIALLTGSTLVKLAVSPVIEVRGEGADQPLAPGEGRTQFGLPVIVKPQIGVYGALGRTIATTDDNRAGTTISGGVSFLFNARVTK